MGQPAQHLHLATGCWMLTAVEGVLPQQEHDSSVRSTFGPVMLYSASPAPISWLACPDSGWSPSELSEGTGMHLMASGTRGTVRTDWRPCVELWHD